MVKLTERLVLARTRASDLDNVRKLNCWASDLTDVSIIKKMQNVQIVSLSVNHITSLEDFSESMSMEELYIRKNDIANLAEIHYLRRLPRLRVLWLADNPCAVGDRYRMTVLKALPNLQRLDNIPVQEDEVNEAIEQGLDLTPLAETLKSMKSTPESSPVQIRKSKKFKEKKELENSVEKQADKDTEAEQPQEKVIEKVLELEGSGLEREGKQTEDLQMNDNKDEVPEDTKDESATEEAVGEKEDSVDSIPDTNCEPTPDMTTTDGTPTAQSEMCKEQTDTVTDEEVEEESDDIEEGEITIENNVQETNEIRARLGLKPLAAEKVSQPTHSRPSTGTKARNANILQAVLHLIRELDGDSLQVVSDVVRTKLEAL